MRITLVVVYPRFPVGEKKEGGGVVKVVLRIVNSHLKQQ